MEIAKKDITESFVPDPHKPTLLWMSLYGKADKNVLKDLVRGYNVMFDQMERGDANKVCWLAHRYMVDFILLPRQIKTPVIAYIKRYMPTGCGLLRIKRLPTIVNGQPDYAEYERIVDIQEVVEPWLRSNDPYLAKYVKDKEPYPRYLIPNDQESDGISSVHYPKPPEFTFDDYPLSGFHLRKDFSENSDDDLPLLDIRPIPR